MSKEAMKLALEALEHMLEDAKQERLTVEYWNECVDAITALREALAEQPAPVAKPHEQEPVGVVINEKVYSGFGEHRPVKTVQWVGTPPPAGVNVYTYPPAQRKPLDAGEISRLWKQHTSEDGPHHNPYDDDGLGFARAIEAAHGIKERKK